MPEGESLPAPRATCACRSDHRFAGSCSYRLCETSRRRLDTNPRDFPSGFRRRSVVARTAGRTFKRFLSKVSSTIKGGKKKVRAHRLFAKTADARRLVLVQLTNVVAG